MNRFDVKREIIPEFDRFARSGEAPRLVSPKTLSPNLTPLPDLLRSDRAFDQR
jgi:hypothetical protein